MLSEFIHIRKKISPEKISSGEIFGEIVLSTKDIEILESLINNECAEDFFLSGKEHIPLSKLTEGLTIKVRIFPIRIKDGKYYESIEELINAHSEEYPKGRFYVYELDYDSKNPEKPHPIEYYEQVTTLISFLKSISDYQKKSELVFFQAKPLVINLKYEPVDLTNLTGINELIEHITVSADKEERKTIFTNEMISFLSEIPELNERFKHLLRYFNDLDSSYRKSHSLYLEKYSYHKLRTDLDKDIIEYSKKIQSVINDAQGKLVAIPAAFLLIISKFDLTGNDLHLNVSLLIGAFVFSVLLEVLLRNQFSALQFIKHDIDRFKKSINENKSEVIRDELSEIFGRITKLYDKQIFYLNVIRFLIWTTPILAIFLLIVSMQTESIQSLFNLIFFCCLS